jgi:putative ABC transport system permease protein
MNVWRLALRNVTRNRRRSLLTGGVVVFGFAAFALAGGFMAQSLTGLREGTIRSGMGHLQFADPAAFSPGGDSTMAHALPDAGRIAAAIAARPGVREVLPRLEFVGLLSNGAATVPFLGVGLDPDPEARATDLPSTVVSGQWLENRADRDVILGTGLAAALSVGVGDVVTLLATTRDGTLNAVDATVIGLVDLPIKELNDRYLATTLGLASDLLGAAGAVSKVVVYLRDTGDTAAALRDIEATLAGAGFKVRGMSWRELAQFYGQVRMLYFGIFGFMGMILVAVVLLASANTMMMAASERTREIGTLRAIGTRPGLIRRMFIAEGIVLSVCGSIAGAILSLALRVVLNHSGIVLPPPPGATRGMPLHVEFHAVAYAAGAIAMILTLALASWVPARRASRIPIVEALTHV